MNKHVKLIQPALVIVYIIIRVMLINEWESKTIAMKGKKRETMLVCVLCYYCNDNVSVRRKSLQQRYFMKKKERETYTERERKRERDC